MERINLNKINEVEDEKQYWVKISTFGEVKC
jgi:hypothetical protein